MLLYIDFCLFTRRNVDELRDVGRPRHRLHAEVVLARLVPQIGLIEQDGRSRVDVGHRDVQAVAIVHVHVDQQVERVDHNRHVSQYARRPITWRRQVDERTNCITFCQVK